MKKRCLSYTISPLDFTDDEIQNAFLKNQLIHFQNWCVDQFMKKADIENIVMQRSQFIDRLLQRLWLYYAIPNCTSSLLTKNRLALIAVGGYGRQELHPLSDIDILVLSDKPLSAILEKQIANLVRMLWDIHLVVGHSVRTLKSCLEEAKNDITVMTNLIESRLIIGNQSLMDLLQNRVFSPKIWPTVSFFHAKMEEQRQRHSQYYSTSYNLEPDLKNSPGNLRDIHTIRWIAIRHFNGVSITEIVKRNYLKNEEFQTLKNCQRFLWRMRFALHSVINRYDNRLLFERQLNIAKMLGYQGEGNQSVERMMHDYYRVAHTITELNHILLQFFNESILKSKTKCQLDIEPHFEIKDNLIDIKDDQLFKKNPIMIMEIFYTMLCYKQAEGLHANAIRQLRSARRQLPYLLSTQSKAREIFLLIIQHPDAIKKAILPMHRYGILAEYIPGWKNIVGMMQFDLFHIYTVDEHTIRLLLELDNLKTAKGQKKHPNSSVIFKSLAKPELLIIAALFHDIAKGQGGDHSELGGELVDQFAKLHDLDDESRHLVIWLVRYHLLMSVTAQNRDLQDPAVIRQFAKTVKNKQRLQYLLCLTVADVCATNETLWNSWKQSLLRELYFATERSFDLGIHQIPNQRSIAHQHKKMARAELIKQGYDINKLQLFWSNYRFDYFMRYSVDQIIWHVQSLLDQNLTHTQVLINPSPSHGGTEVFVYTKDRTYLFAVVCRVLSNSNLNIHDSLIYTNKKGYASDTFIVLSPDGTEVTQNRHLEIKQKIEYALSQPVYRKMARKPLKKQLLAFSVPTQVNFLSTLSDHQTYVELISLDRPGLLDCVAEVFADLGLSLHSAKITTIGEKVEDLFILTDMNNKVLSDEKCYELREAMISAINSMGS